MVNEPGKCIIFMHTEKSHQMHRNKTNKHNKYDFRVLHDNDIFFVLAG